MVTMSIGREISQRVKERREYLFRTTRKNLTQAHMADLVELERSTYANKENGKFPFTAEEIAKVAKVLKVSVSYLYGEEDNIGPSSNTYYEGLAPARKTAVDEIIKAFWEQDQREETTHGPKAE